MRKGDWIETSTGKRFWPLDPQPEDICIDDIVHGLSQICRYNGQCRFFFSVAQHSMNCAVYTKRLGLSARWQLLCLLHDAAEAYISDVAKPLKPFIPQFKEIEQNIQAAIYVALRVRPPNAIEASMIKQVDTIMLITEARKLMPFVEWGKWVDGVVPDEEMIICEKPIGDVERLFGATIKELLLEIKEKVAKRFKGGCSNDHY